MKPSEIREIHVVCNTHWDREFRDTFEKTRAKLQECLDTVLNLLASDNRYTSYTLDGHTVLAEDYLEVRPERREEFIKRLRERRLFIGPWYTLPDAMNVGGEALVRNLLWGRKVAASFGVEPMRAGYCPNNWGQPSQIPQILRGFGIGSALIYRGISPHECPSEFLWRSPDGSEVLGHRFARLARYNWYYKVHRPVTRGKDWLDKSAKLAKSLEAPVRVADGLQRGPANILFTEPSVKLHARRVGEAVRDLLELEAGDCTTGIFLAMHGHDISVAHPLDPTVVKMADDALPNTRVFLSNLEDFIQRVEETLDREKAVVLHGERRMNLKEGFWTYLLPGTISIRAPLKVQNWEAENALTLLAEPLATAAWMREMEYPTELIDRAWRYLLGNHTHDAIAGCAPDAVSQDVAYRARQALDLADVVCERSMAHMAKALGPRVSPRGAMLVAFNTLPHDRFEVMEIEVALPADTGDEPLVVGHSLAVEELGREDDSLFVDNQWDVPTIASVRRAHLRVGVPLDASTPHLLPVVPEGTPEADEIARRLSELGDAPAPVTSPGDRQLDNGIVHLTIEKDGTATLHHHATGREFIGLGQFLDEGATGTFWWPAFPKVNPPVRSEGPAEFEVVERGSLQSTLRTRQTLQVPKCVEDDRRSENLVPLTIETTWTLRMGDPLVRVEVAFDNQARDHRLRMLFPSGVRTDEVVAGAHLDAVRRPIAHPDCEGWIEPHHGTAPMQGFVDLSDGAAGLALLPAGLLEYEIFNDEPRTIALTLIRSIPIRLAVSEEKQEVLPDRGPLCLGPQRYRFALCPHAGDHIAAHLWHQAQRLAAPPRVIQVGEGPRVGRRSRGRSLVAIDNPAVVATAIKRAEDREGYIVRLFNPSDAEQIVGVSVPMGFAHAERTDMAETPLERLQAHEGHLTLAMPPHRIETIRFSRVE